MNQSAQPSAPVSASASAPASAPASAQLSAPVSAWHSPWVRAWIALVVVVLAVNALMVTLAFVTSPGLVVADYYERGRAMEEGMRSRVAANANRMPAADIPAHLIVGQPTTLRFFVVDRVGQPVSPDAVTLFVYRPADARQDFSLPMIEEAPGRYAVQLSFPLPGVWDTLFEVTEGESRYQLDERLSVNRRQPEPEPETEPAESSSAAAPHHLP